MDYETIAHAVKLGGTVFFFGFFFVAMTYLFWPINAKSFSAAFAQIMVVFLITAALIIWAFKTGGFAIIVLGIVLLVGYLASLYYYRTSNDPAYQHAASIPLGDESIIGPRNHEVLK